MGTLNKTNAKNTLCQVRTGFSIFLFCGDYSSMIQHPSITITFNIISCLKTYHWFDSENSLLK